MSAAITINRCDSALASTYMLTWDDLEGLCASGALKRWIVRSPAPGFRPRLLYLASDVHVAIATRPWPDADGEAPYRTKARRQAMRSVLERYVRGEGLNLNRDLKEMGTRDMSQAMRGFWSIRSQGPIHETRIFGFFARKAAFVGLRFGSRANMKDEDFSEECRICVDEWDRLTDSAAYLTNPWPVRLRSQLSDYINET